MNHENMTTLIRILKFFETEQIINVSVEWDSIQKPTLFGIASINELILYDFFLIC